MLVFSVMLDLKFVCENSEVVRENLSQRGSLKNDDPKLKKLLKSNDERKKIIGEVERLRQTQNQVSKEIAATKDKSSVKDKIDEMKKVSDKVKDLSQKLSDIETTMNAVLLELPNITHASVSQGKNKENNKEIRKWGKVPSFDFTPKDHQAMGEKLGILDSERATKIAGSRFTLYKGWGAKLERALINFMLDINTKEGGYLEIIPPFIVNKESMTGTGQLPKFAEDAFKIEGMDFYLIPTSEVPLCNIYRNEILSKKQLPFNVTAYSPCFRKEAGSYGKDIRGLIRQHQFNKVEIVKVVEPESSYDELEKLTQDAEKILQRLELPYRIVSLCTADIGFSAAKTYDIEVWLPSEKQYREISSCSNCEDFQARRMNLRYRPDEKSKLRYPHTLNGSALAVGRTVIAILENYQQKDGSVAIPKVLQPDFGTDLITPI